MLVDGAHVPGTLPTDIAALGADVWVGNFHKWLFAPRGTAGLWLAPQLRDRVRPLVLGWAADAGYPDSFDARGTQDLTGWMALPDAARGLGRPRRLGDGGPVQPGRDATGQQLLADAVRDAGFEMDLSVLPDRPAPTMRLRAAADRRGRRPMLPPTGWVSG